jgi:DNA-binding NtrC family response regulator
MESYRVLLVDDEHEFVETLAKRMKARGLRVDTAESGEAALAIVRARDFDVIVLDLAMPGIDGLETLERALQINPDVQVILLTGHGTVGKGVEAMKLGAADFLEKPTSFQDLLDRIKTASEKKALLLEKRSEEHVADILNKRGW